MQLGTEAAPRADTGLCLSCNRQARIAKKNSKKTSCHPKYQRSGDFCGEDLCMSAIVDVHAGRKHDEVEYADQHKLLIAAHGSA